jgi:hypothetical protein
MVTVSNCCLDGGLLHEAIRTASNIAPAGHPQTGFKINMQQAIPSQPYPQGTIRHRPKKCGCSLFQIQKIARLKSNDGPVNITGFSNPNSI